MNKQFSKSLGNIIEIDGINCYHLASTNNGSSDFPLLNKKLKVVGIHKGCIKSNSETY